MIFATIIEWRTHLPRPVPRAHPPIPRRAGQPNHVDGFRLLIQLSVPVKPTDGPIQRWPIAHRSRSSTYCLAVVTAHGPARCLSSPLPSPPRPFSPPCFILHPHHLSSRPVLSPAAPRLLPIHTSVRLHAQTRGTRSSSSS
jgi:hypothetical protein